MLSFRSRSILRSTLLARSLLSFVSLSPSLSLSFVHPHRVLPVFILDKTLKRLWKSLRLRRRILGLLSAFVCGKNPAFQCSFTVSKFCGKNSSTPPRKCTSWGQYTATHCNTLQLTAIHSGRKNPTPPGGFSVYYIP